MNKNPIDRLFRQKLKGEAEPYPAHLWEGISHRINVEDGGNGRVMWIRWSALGLFLLLALSSGYYVFQWGQSDGTAPYGEANIGIETSRDGVYGKDNGKTQDGSSAHPGLKEDKPAISQPGTVAIPGSSGENDVVNRSTQKGLSHKTTTSLTGIPSLENHQNNQPSISSTLPESGTNTISNNSQGQQQSVAKAGKTRGDATDQGSITEPGGSGSERGADLRQTRELIETDKCPALDRRTIIESEEDKKARSIRKAVADLTPAKNYRFLGKMSLAMIYGPNAHFRTLEAKSDESLALAGHRSKHEKFANSFTTGLELRMKIRQWSLHSGLHYTQLAERNTYLLENSEKFIDGIKRTGALERSVVNRYRILEIPVMMGYEVTRGPWALELQAGASFGLMLRADGELFDESTLANRPLDDEFNPFRSNAGTSVSGGLMLSYKTGYFSSVFIRPYYRHYLNPMTSDAYGLDQKYANTGLVAGYRIML